MHLCTDWLEDRFIDVRKCIIAAVFALPVSLGADTVTLRSGIVFYDVKTRPAATSHHVYFIDGGIITLANSLISSVRPGPTTWTEPVFLALKKPPRTIKAREATETIPLPRQRSVPWTPILKSTILPGWGQFSEGRKISGSLYAAGAVFLFSRYWTIRQAHSRAEAEYNDPAFTGAVASQTLTGSMSIGQAAMINLTYLSGKEREVYRLEKQGNLTAFLLGSLWAWNLLDIVTEGAPWEWKWLGGGTSKSTYLSVTFCPTPKGMLIAARMAW